MNTAYDARDWLRALALHRSDTFRKLLPALCVAGLFTWAVHAVEVQWLHLTEDSHVAGLPVLHSLLGFAISMLLVFRTNTAYDRWWEARKLWGQLVNTSRNLAVKLQVLLPSEDEASRRFFARLISLFAHELRIALLSERTRVELDASPHPEIPDLDRTRHVPTQVVTLVQQRIARLVGEGKLTGEQLLVLDKEVVQLLEICGACERIKNTPIPYSYSSFLKKFIVIYAVTLPFGLVFSLGLLAIPVVVLVFYVLASLEVIAAEIEDPFGRDVQDLPMERLAEQIGRNVEGVLGG